MTDQQQQQQAQPQQMQQPPQPLTPPPVQQAQQAQQAPQVQPSYITFGTTAPQIPQQQQAQTPPPANPYQSIIAEQKAQIEALMQQNNTLSGQITQMVQNGYQAVQQQQPQQVQQPQQQAPHVGQNWAMQPQYAPVYMPEQTPLSLSQDVSLEGLASEIGKAPENGQG